MWVTVIEPEGGAGVGAGGGVGAGAGAGAEGVEGIRCVGNGGTL